jgi:hypothetical protein
MRLGGEKEIMRMREEWRNIDREIIKETRKSKVKKEKGKVIKDYTRRKENNY